MISYFLFPESPMATIAHKLILTVAISTIIASFFSINTTMLMIGLVILAIALIQEIRISRAKKEYNIWY